ncbi:hypothetical protein E1091_01505 [Micromonospora fluostatini]|uniref:Uncharacterized protein n=1 Tax=Micromonospora fluostatini TaxID=1629071 RepID=A0ABY2DLI6_9ACTN|nr:hypothetical protein E1091_01505 [Micromonospora fluostatini]
MTTVVAYGDGRTVWMAADTCTNVYERPVIGGATKILRLDAVDDDVLVGLAGHGGLASVLPETVLPISPEEGEPTQNWANAVALALTQRAIEHGLVDDGQLDGNLILGWRGQVWTIAHAMAIPHPDGVAAVGSGEGPAIGALDALRICDVHPTKAIQLAVEIACRRDRYSMPPLQVEVLEWHDPATQLSSGAGSSLPPT